MFDFGQQAVIDGVDPHNWEGLNKYTDEKLGPLYGNEFRYHEYAAMNLVPLYAGVPERRLGY